MKINTKIHIEVLKHVDPTMSSELDEIMIERANEQNIGILHMYSWNPKAISIGNLQNIDTVNVDKAVEDGIPVVRRKTNGGALMIGPEDFVMSLAIGKNVFPDIQKGIRIYCKFNGILVDALGRLGVTADKSPEKVESPCVNSECFASLERGEIVDINGHKIFGSDYSRMTDNGYFQQGYIPLTTLYKDLPSYMNHESPPVVDSTDLASTEITFEEMCDSIEKSLYTCCPEWRPQWGI